MSTPLVRSTFSCADCFSHILQKPALIADKIKHFIKDPNAIPAYGYQDNVMAGIGYWMMQGGRFAISCYDRGSQVPGYLAATIQKTCAIFIAIITSPFTIIGSLIKIIASQFPYKVGNLTSDMIPRTSPAKIDQIYDLLQIINEVLRNHHIPYSMDGGTMLGAFRDKGVIPWDDDGDIVILDEHKDALSQLQAELKAKGVVLKNMGLEVFQIAFDTETLQARGIDPTNTASVDIFINKKDNDGTIAYTSNFLKNQFPNAYFLEDELQNMVEYPFGPPEKGLFLPGPRNPERFLQAQYGSDCMDYAIRSHSHIQLGPFTIPIVNLCAAKYKIVPGYAEGNSWKSGSSPTS